MLSIQVDIHLGLSATVFNLSLTSYTFRLICVVHGTCQRTLSWRWETPFHPTPGILPAHLFIVSECRLCLWIAFNLCCSMLLEILWRRMWSWELHMLKGPGFMERVRAVRHTLMRGDSALIHLVLNCCWEGAYRWTSSQDNTGKTIFRNLDWSQLFHSCAQVTSWFRPRLGVVVELV